MENISMKKQSLPLLVMIFIILYALSFIPVEGELWGVEFKSIDIFSDLKEDTDVLYEDDFFEDWESDTDTTSSTDNRIERKDFATIPNYNYAGINLLGNIEKTALDFIDSEKEKIDKFLESPVQPRQKTKIVGNTQQMKHFFSALKNAKSQKVRIAHYGDSQIEGDLVTGDLRENLRKEFGGTGAGYLAITSQDISFRVTTKHEYPENKWTTGSVFMGNETGLPYGISGESFLPKASASVTYTAYNKYRSTSKFREIYIIYSDAQANDFTAYLDNKPEKVKLNKAGGFQQAEIIGSGSVRSLKLEIPQNNAAIFYGVFLEDGNGVYVDNFALRGNSGEDLDKIPSKIIEDFNKYRNYSLVIFQFGKNAISGNYKRYEKEMVKVINKFKAALPNTSFLMISVQDSGFKTSSRIVNLLKAQMDIAKETNIAFWNLFEAMGGENSMSAWVKNNPPLASADHTHFNLQGAQIVGEMLSEALIDLYKNMK